MLFARKKEERAGLARAVPVAEHRLLDNQGVTTHNYGMSYSKQRTSFALDPETMKRLQLLAGRWGVSQAEVVRRSVRQAADADRSDSEGLVARLAAYQHGGRLVAEEADAYLRQVDADRRSWERGGGSGATRS